MYTSTTTDRARWEVLWFVKGKWVRKDCESDFFEALRIYTLAVNADKQGATLRCKNMSFPPPVKYADTETVVTKVVKGRKVFKRTTQEVIEPHQFKVKMGEVNRRGIFWCPFCVKFRKFVKAEHGLTYEGRYYGEPQMQCPACGISHNHGIVKKYNPYAHRGAGRKTRSDKGVARG